MTQKFSFDLDQEKPAIDSGSYGNAEDPMYEEAVKVVLQNDRASISLVQRNLRIGYNRAARLIESMERAGLVSAMDKHGNREVLEVAA